MLRRLLDSPRTYYALAAILFVLAVLSQFEISTPTRSRGDAADLADLASREDVNLLFILVDTLRADRLHAYGYARETSPWMDDLARSGVRFERVVSQSSWTKCSMASLWTATYPVRNGILRWGHALPEEALLPAEQLRAAGFRTAGIFRNGWVASNFGFGQGFQNYMRPNPSVSPDAPKRSPRSHERLKGSDEDLTRAALEFLRTYPDERFMLYVHYMDAHQYTYSEGSALFGTSYSDAYDNAIHWTDQNIGVLLRELDAQGLRDRTIVVLASDHGEEFLEHGREGHAKSLYREVTEVPWIISFPFMLDTSVVVKTTVENVDIWPTLLDLLGVPSLPEADGRSRRSEIERALAATPAEDEPFTAFAQLDRRWGNSDVPPMPLVAVTQGDYRLIVPLDSNGSEPVELYDHSVDPREAKNVLEENPEVGARLQEQVDAYLARPPAQWGKPVEAEISDLERGQLQALGYVVR